MTDEQLKRVRKMLGTTSVPLPSVVTGSRAADWRTDRMHITTEVSLGSFVRKDPKYGPTD